MVVFPKELIKYASFLECCEELVIDSSLCRFDDDLVANSEKPIETLVKVRISPNSVNDVR